jgi:NitT/TauT family transport system permease protein
MTGNPRLTRILQATASTLGIAALWQVASLFFPHYLFPPVPDIVARTVGIVFSWPLLSEVLVTALRIFAGLFGAFVLGAAMALAIGRSPRIEAYVTPVLVFLQGIPALSWVVIAIIWFHGIEFRIFFIMVVTTLPAFTFQILDAFRSMSKDLFEMTMSFRPRRWTLFRVLIVPTIVPGILTAWKVNLGNAARVVVVAELVGATGGVGYELLRHCMDAAARAVRSGGAADDHRDRRLGVALPRGVRARDLSRGSNGPAAHPLSRRQQGVPPCRRPRRPHGRGQAFARGRPGRDRRGAGQDRLRQVHDVQPDRRPDRAHLGPGHRQRPRSVP